MKRSRFLWSVAALAVLGSLAYGVPAIPAQTPPRTGSSPAEGMEVEIKGQFRGRLLVKKIVAPVTFNLEKLQDFPEDPAQKILLTPMSISPTMELNARSELKGHAPFYPWIPSIPEPPFLRMITPEKTKPVSWIFEVLNPQGQVVFRQRGTHALPDEFIWEGQDSEKHFAIVDRLYSCQLTLMHEDEKAEVIQGPSAMFPYLAYTSDGPQNIEISLSRLFKAEKAELSPEGYWLLGKVCERIRERTLSKIHLRISQQDSNLATQRETALAEILQKMLHLSADQVQHDHNTAQPSLRGEIAVIWAKSTVIR